MYLNTNYKNTEYYSKIEEDYKRSLLTLVDIHKATSENEECFQGGLSFSYYPYAADCEAISYFYKQYPKSKFADIFKKLDKNMSSFDYNTEKNPVSPHYS